MRRRLTFLLSLIGLLLVAGAAPALAAENDEVALFDSNRGEWHLRNPDGSTTQFFYGLPGDVPMLGDWDCDGVDTVGMFRPSNGFVYIRNTNDLGVADFDFFYGEGGDVPLVGDWNGDECDTLAIYRRGEVFVRNELGTGFADYSFFFGNPGDRPFSGDFDNDGVTTVGLYRETSGLAYFTNQNESGVAEFEFFYGVPSDQIVAGDWDGVDGASVGIYRRTDGRFYLSQRNVQGPADEVFAYGEATWIPVAGHHQPLPSSLVADRAALDLGWAGIDVTTTRTIGGSFVGESTDPTVTIRRIDFVGQDASLFSGDVAGSVQVNPFGRFRVDVNAQPDRLGPISATMRIHHSGQNSPLLVPVFAEGIYRINAGGPDSVEGWLADDPISEFVSGTTAAFATPGSVSGSSVPAELFDTYRFGAMEWAIPVSPGRYTVNLFFAETFLTGAGDRTFDVSIEGASSLSGFNISSAAGGNNRATSRSFTVEADGVLNVDFFPTSGEPPLVNAIEVIRVPEPGKLGAVPTSIDFGSVATGATARVDVTLVNLGTTGDPIVSITGASLSGTVAPFGIVGATPASLAPGETVVIGVEFSPSSESQVFGALNIANSGGLVSVQLQGRGSDVIVHRINAGGPPISGALPWADGRNVATGLTSSVGTAGNVGIGDPSLPLGTPQTVFLTEQFGTMQWDLPVESGTYEVRLYLAERFHNAGGVRRFNVGIEGAARNGIDIFSLAGGKDVGMMLPTTVIVTDGVLDINFTPIVDQPTVMGIEVVKATGSATLAAEPSGLNFGKLAPGASESRTVTIRNTSATQSIELAGSTIGGPQAPRFSATSSLDTIAPGRTVDLTVVYSASGTGEQSAILNVAHDGDGAPLTVALSGVSNTSPSLPPGGPFTVSEGLSSGTFVTSISAVDPDDTSFSYAIIGGSGSGRFSISGSGAITTSGALDYESIASFTVLVRVTDSLGATDTRTYTINVTNVNEPPLLAPIADQLSPIGSGSTLTPSATDPDAGEVLTYSATGLPTGLSMLPGGAINGTIAASASGTYSVTVTVSDGEETDTTSFDWTIDTPPTLTLPPPFSVNEGEPIIGTITYGDDQAGVTATATKVPPSAWLGISDNGAGTITLFGTGPASGAATVTVVVTDSAGQTASGSFTVTVVPNLDPTVSVPPQTYETGGPISPLTITGVDIDGTIASTVVTGLPAGLTATNNGASATVSGTPSAVGGPTTVSVLVTDNDGGTGSTTFTITVTDGTAPSVPTGLASASVTQTSFTLSWVASTDNVGVTGYRVRQNGAVIGNPTGATFPVSGLLASTAYSFTVQARDAAGNFSAASAPLSVTTLDPPNSAPVVGASGPGSVTLPALASLDGTVTDDGLPNPPGSLTYLWTVVSGPGTVTFGTPTAVDTTASFSVAGSYVLRLTASDSVLSNSADVAVTVGAANTAPVVGASGPGSVTLPDTASLDGTVTDDGLPNPPGSLTYLWTVVSGPGTVTFGTPTAVDTTASFSVAGSYVLRLTASDSVLSNSADVAVTVGAANTAPVVGASGPGSVTLPDTASLDGTVTDDGLPNPPGSLTYLWTVVSGPGTVTFGTPTAVDTTASFSVAGSYVLRLTASDSVLSNSADVAVTVGAANTAPVVGASGPGSVTLPDTASLDGTVTDDGLPNPPGSLTYLWTVVSGPGTVTFGTPTAVDTTASFSVAGSYVLRLTASDSVLSNSADVAVTVGAANTAPVVGASGPGSVTLPDTASLDGTVTDDGLPNPPGSLTYLWTVVWGPGTVTFGTPTAVDTTASFSVAGSYVLRLTASDSVLSNSADVTITVNP